MRALIYTAVLAVLILGLTTTEPGAEVRAESPATKNEQTIVFPVRPHILKPDPNGKEQIGDVRGNPDEGKPIYQKFCFFCHGESGRGDGIAATGLKPTPADLTKTYSRWGPLDDEAAGMVDQYVFEIITYGIEGSYQLAMPAFGPILSRQERVNVIAYIKVITADDALSTNVAGYGGTGSSNGPSATPDMDQGIQIGNDPAEYDPVTGEPLCTNCHTSDRRPAINYINDPECRQCHESDYSERFLAIDERYKVPVEEATERYRHHANKVIPEPETTNVTREGTLNPPEGMVLVPAGVFIMGTNNWWPKSGPEHKRELPDYLIDVFEVTNKDYKAFVDATGHRAPDHWQQGGIPRDRGNHPVTFVDWFDATAYCEWKGKRLPTEAEWEKAARGTDGRSFPWGNEFDKNKANTPQYGHKDTLPVGQFEAGKSPYGAYDMAGNVFEWTADWYKAYPGNKHPDPNEGERYRVVKGGSWYDCTYYMCGISAPTFNRIFFNPYTRNNNFGFRCVLSVE